jgi:hypothetical protein
VTANLRNTLEISMQHPPTTQSPNTAPHRRPWTAPRVAELPRLTELTLQTGDFIPGTGGTGGGGSTVF